MTAVPRILISAPSSGHAKSAVAVGLLAGYAARGLVTAGFKVGPDRPRAGQTPAWSWSGSLPEGFVSRRVHASQLMLHWAGDPGRARRLLASMVSAVASGFVLSRVDGAGRVDAAGRVDGTTAEGDGPGAVEAVA